MSRDAGGHVPLAFNSPEAVPWRVSRLSQVQIDVVGAGSTAACTKERSAAAAEYHLPTCFPYRRVARERRPVKRSRGSGCAGCQKQIRAGGDLLGSMPLRRRGNLGQTEVSGGCRFPVRDILVDNRVGFEVAAGVDDLVRSRWTTFGHSMPALSRFTRRSRQGGRCGWWSLMTRSAVARAPPPLACRRRTHSVGWQNLDDVPRPCSCRPSASPSRRADGQLPIVAMGWFPVRGPVHSVLHSFRLHHPFVFHLFHSRSIPHLSLTPVDGPLSFRLSISLSISFH